MNKTLLLRPCMWLASLMLLIACVSGCAGNKPTPAQDEALAKQEKGSTIEINNDTDPTKNPMPRECSLSKGNKPDEDHVRWHNVSGQDITLTFIVWPFMEDPPAPITIVSGEYSPYFSLNKKLPTGVKFTYSASPPLPSGGPGEPAIVDGP